MLVSCILPTKDRAKYIPQAIRSYQSQTYPARELIIVDNGFDGTPDLIPDDPSIRYHHVEGPQTTGDMRNICAKLARGEFICHFDSDDWSAPERVTDQVTRLGTFGMLTGYYSALFYDEQHDICYRWEAFSPVQYLLGSSLCYRRHWWEHHPFPSVSVGEDVKFVRLAFQEAHRFVYMAPSNQLIVARVHDHQTCRKSLTSNSYQQVPVTMLPEAFPRCVST